jgi:hypothetical protein
MDVEILPILKYSNVFKVRLIIVAIDYYFIFGINYKFFEDSW